MLWEATRLALNGLEDLAPGWNSYDSPAIKPEAIAAARSFLEQIAGWAKPPFVVPTNTGGVQLEWELPRAYLSLAFDGQTIDACWFDGPVDSWLDALADETLVGRAYAIGLVLWIQRKNESEIG